MKLKIALIRHGETENSEGRLLGATDIPLSENGKRSIKEKCEKNAYPATKYIYSCGLSCCRETANLIYASPTVILKELQAPDYGDFDGRAFPELLQDKAFTNWMDSQAIAEFPNGEMIYAANERACSVIRDIGAEMQRKMAEQCAIISHKMIILAMLRQYCVPRSNYADWELPYGGGYLIIYDTVETTAKVVSKI